MVAITFDSNPLTAGPLAGPETDAPLHGAPRLQLVPDGEVRRPFAVVLTAFAALVLAIAFAYLAMTPELTEQGTVPVAEVGYTAVAGDSMWSIAQDHGPAGETATYVERLVAANGTSTVVTGQRIVLPTS